MVVKYHYSKVLPKLTTHFLCDRELKAVVSLGWGVRPLHTIKKLFPSLATDDYFEIGKMCVAEEMPKNTESQFLARVVGWVKENEPNKKILFTWADGMLAKPGYVYQASNFLYGGYIWTDTYFTDEGEKIHPRMTGKIGGRPSKEYMKNNGWLHFRGKQFRYAYFLCGNKERKRLLKESSVEWSRTYPKESDMAWRVMTDSGWIDTDRTPYDPLVMGFSDSLAYSHRVASQLPLLGDIDAGEVSRGIRSGSTGEGTVTIP